ncbi:MAG: FkbM family methyltransferase, partial [Paracoccaceae bacterium]
SEIDFLKIDTEGHELNILKSFSFKVRPRSIKVEHRLTDDLAISEILRQENYLTWTEENDIYAIG